MGNLAYHLTNAWSCFQHTFFSLRETRHQVDQLSEIVCSARLPRDQARLGAQCGVSLTRISEDKSVNLSPTQLRSLFGIGHEQEIEPRKGHCAAIIPGDWVKSIPGTTGPGPDKCRVNDMIVAARDNDRSGNAEGDSQSDPHGDSSSDPKGDYSGDPDRSADHHQYSDPD